MPISSSLLIFWTFIYLVSVCFDTFRGTESLEKKGLNRLLNNHLAKCLVDSIKEAQDKFVDSSQWDLEHVSILVPKPVLQFPTLWFYFQVFQSSTIKEFDQRFTSKLFGYKDYKEYYTDARIKGKITKIRVPTLALNAEDDPFSPGESLPVDEAKRSDYFAFLTTKYGGHIGFMEGTKFLTSSSSNRVEFNHALQFCRHISHQVPFLWPRIWTVCKECLWTCSVSY